MIKGSTKKPLYRKVNTTAHGVRHQHGGNYKDNRRHEHAITMKHGIQRGLDYTPLFRFLLSKAGHPWNQVHSEAVARLDKQEPVYWLVARDRDSASEVIRTGENSYFSGLYIDDEGILQIVNPTLNESSLAPDCKCCTHTFNGIPFTRKYN